MRQIYLDRISKAFPGRELFSELTWQINLGEKISLVGRNGVGKTTLFKIINGEIKPDEGEIIRARGLKIGYLPQEAQLESGQTLWLELLEAFRDLLAIRDELRTLEQEIALDSTDPLKLERYGKLQELFEHAGGFSYEDKIKFVLHGLGFPEEVWLREIRSFSGGEKNRILLAKLLLGEPDLLLLDEPTNYLDIESTAWLEEFLTAFKGSVVVVSHDRSFLNKVAQMTVELNRTGLDIYHGNYDLFEKESLLRLELAQKAYEAQAEEIARIQDFIQKNIAGQKTKQAQSRRRMLAKLKPLDRPGRAAGEMKLQIKSSGRSWLKILEAKELSKSFLHKTLFSDANFTIQRGEKIGLIGPNGSGKTTLARIITGQLEPDQGEVEFGNNVDYTYYDQELLGLDLNVNVIDTIWEEKPNALAEELRSYLGKFLFSGDDIFRLVKSLSGGEKSRLSLAKIFFNPANFLILDEPTNHLDIPSCQILEKALVEFGGAVLIISHDRYFLDRTVNKIFALEDEVLMEYRGNFTNYWERLQARKLEQTIFTEKKEKSLTKVNWEKLKDERRHSRRIEKAEQEIIQVEEKITEILEQLEDPLLGSNWEKLISLQEEKTYFEKELQRLYDEYEKLNE